MSEELKPCPFCGKDEANFTTDKWGNYYVECEYCGAQTNPYDDKEIVIEEWQTRPIEDDLIARIAELSQAVGLITTLKPTMVMDADHPLEMAKEVAEYVNNRIAELEKDNAEFRQLIRDWSIVLEQDDYFQLWHVESVRQAMLEINKEREE